MNRITKILTSPNAEWHPVLAFYADADGQPRWVIGNDLEGLVGRARDPRLVRLLDIVEVCYSDDDA